MEYAENTCNVNWKMNQSVTTKYIFEAPLYLNLKSPKLDLQVMNYGGLGNFKESNCLFRRCQVVAWVRLLLLIKEGWATIKVLLLDQGEVLTAYSSTVVNTVRLLWSSQAGWRFSSNVWTSFMRHLKWIHQPGWRKAQTGPCTLLFPSPWGKEAPYKLYFLCPIHCKTPGRWE